jgi:hypothetical protein
MENMSIAISIISLFIATAAFITNKRSFLLTIANQRAEKVNAIFKIACINTKIASINDSHYISFWSDIISEIIISYNILNMTAGNKKIKQQINGLEIVQRIFWEQLHTTIRIHFKSYNPSLLNDNPEDNEFTVMRKRQIRTILAYYKANN